MMKAILPWTTTALGIAAIFGLSSCGYTPTYYGPPPTGGYAYGASTSTYVDYPNVSTSLFISTGNPRWGYDPYSYSYFDYTTRCYYDPWLNGYYPRGYRPPIIVGARHPHGWHEGRKICPPPSHVRNHHLSNYRDRDSAYHRLNHSWSRNVRTVSDHHRDGGYRSGMTSGDQIAPFQATNTTPVRGNFWNRNTSNTTLDRFRRDSYDPTRHHDRTNTHSTRDWQSGNRSNWNRTDGQTQGQPMNNWTRQESNRGNLDFRTPGTGMPQHRPQPTRETTSLPSRQPQREWTAPTPQPSPSPSVFTSRTDSSRQSTMQQNMEEMRSRQNGLRQMGR